MKRNPRLRFAAIICKELGIDDPICWFNAIDPDVLDFWFAVRLIENEDTEPTMMAADRAHGGIKAQFGAN